MARRNKNKHAHNIINSKIKQAKRSAQQQSDKPQYDLDYPTGEYTEGIGRRKVATARVRIYEGDGDLIVNDMPIAKYFAAVRLPAAQYMKPFEITGTKGKFSMTVHVNGSGISAQLGAVVHGISRALDQYDATYRPLLKDAGMLTRDDRMKETRKPGRGGSARSKRQSPRR